MKYNQFLNKHEKQFLKVLNKHGYNFNMKNSQKENPIKNINVKIGVKFNIVWCRQDLRDKKVLKKILNFFARI